MTLYHSSRIKGLKKLEPRISTHGSPYVYAVDNKTLSMLFGAKKDDFDMIVDMQNDVPCVWECYPDALSCVYGGKSCSVYELDGEGFLRGVTGWEPELVCDREVKVLSELNVGDLYTELLHEEQAHRLKIFGYSHNAEYKRIIANHIVDRLIRFELLDKVGDDLRFKRHFKDIVDALTVATDGSLLQ